LATISAIMMIVRQRSQKATALMLREHDGLIAVVIHPDQERFAEDTSTQ